MLGVFTVQREGKTGVTSLWRTREKQHKWCGYIIWYIKMCSLEH